MAQDIFSRRTDTYGGSFAADSVEMTFPNVLGVNGQFAGNFGLLVQQLTTQYSQQITRLYEIGSPAIYLIAGRTDGSLSLDRVVGPAQIQEVFYKKFGDVCQAGSNTLDFAFSTGCGDARIGRASFTSYFCVIQGLGLAIRASDAIINENIRMMFSSFEYNASRI